MLRFDVELLKTLCFLYSSCEFCSISSKKSTEVCHVKFWTYMLKKHEETHTHSLCSLFTYESVKPEHFIWALLSLNIFVCAVFLSIKLNLSMFFVWKEIRTLIISVILIFSNVIFLMISLWYFTIQTEKYKSQPMCWNYIFVFTRLYRRVWIEVWNKAID